MIDAIVRDYDYKLLMEKHIRECVEYFIDKEQTFSILCNLALVNFSPELPKEISKNFKPLTLFVLAGYTFESISLDNEFLYFEAGFGSENFGSFVTVPLYSILQIMVDENVVLVNLTAGTESFENNKKAVDEEGVQNSMNALLSNPENRKFLKK